MMAASVAAALFLFPLSVSAQSAGTTENPGAGSNADSFRALSLFGDVFS